MPHQLKALLAAPSTGHPSWQSDLHSLSRQWTTVVRQVPGGSITVFAAGVALLILVTFALRARSSAAPLLREGKGVKAAGQPLAEAGPLALLGLGGACVSLYGLYGFARQSADLPLPLAGGFMMIFDVAEITCFMSLYRAAGKSNKWTPSMRRKRRMAWVLVGCSSAMNAAHAPHHWLAELVLAAVPVVSARLIEHELDSRLEANAGADTGSANPGPVRLVQLLWLHLWARIFAKLGLDADSVDGQVPQQTRIKWAANVVAQLGRALDRVDELADDPKVRDGERQKAKRRLESLRSRAEAAVDAASVADDPAAMLAMTRHLVTRGRVGDLARMDKSAPLAIMALMEELAIVPGAEALEAGARAIQAEQERKAAEEARDAAIAQQRKAEEAAGGLRAKAAQLLHEAELARTQAEEAVSARLGEASEAEERCEAAKAECNRLKESRDALAEEEKELTRRISEIRTDAATTDDERAKLNARLDHLRRELPQLDEQVAKYRDQATAAQGEARSALEMKRGAEADVEQARAAKIRLEAEASGLAEEISRQRADLEAQVEALSNAVAEREQAEGQARSEAARAAEARRDAQRAEEERRVAGIVLRSAHDELLEALTDPEGAVSPQWRSDAKQAGWELYEQTVRQEGREPSAEELAAATGRDRTTAQHWLRSFAPELARRTAARLPGQQTAPERTPELV